MRQIKFRGRRLNDREWVYGKLISVDNMSAIVFGPIVWTDVVNLQCSDWCFVRVETVGQFTGLHDKNGREIYEGDILFANGEREDNQGRKYYREVQFENGAFCLRCVSLGFNNPLRNHLEKGVINWEVIGNIHEDKFEEI